VVLKDLPQMTKGVVYVSSKTNRSLLTLIGLLLTLIGLLLTKGVVYVSSKMCLQRSATNEQILKSLNILPLSRNYARA
jgi:hypothetical protein